MLDLVLYIYQKIAEDPTLMERPVDEINTLIGSGFNRKDVATAFDRASFCYRRGNPGAIRFFSPDEIRLFSPEAYGFLMNMQLTGILEPKIVELIITRAIVFNTGEVDEEQVRSLAELLLLNPVEGSGRIALDLLTYQPHTGDYS